MFSSSAKKNFVLLLGCSYISLTMCLLVGLFSDTETVKGIPLPGSMNGSGSVPSSTSGQQLASAIPSPTAGKTWRSKSMNMKHSATSSMLATKPPSPTASPTPPSSSDRLRPPITQTPPKQLLATSAPCWRNFGSSTLDLHPEPHPQWPKCLSRRRTICRSLEMRGPAVPHHPAGYQNSMGRPPHPPLHPQTRPTTARTTIISPCHNPKTKRTRTRPRTKQAHHPKRSQW